MNILLIEDEKELQDIALEYLSEFRDVDCAENGFVAFEKLKSTNYEIIITDLRLGAGPDGLEIINHIATGAYPSIKKVIFCSSLLPDDNTLNDLNQRLSAINISFEAQEKMKAYPDLGKKVS